MDVVSIARVCHEANRAYCRALGDTSQASWSNAMDWQRDSAITGVKFHLDHLERGLVPSQAATHESWLEDKRRAGWVYGPVKDADKKTHPCFVPYAELPPDQQKKDALFGAIVAALR
jgi:hypothetical protein